jgi:phosphatidylserine/phosphatidylglycerophosphate/cardiolipin synthase-like enzyme
MITLFQDAQIVPTLVALFARAVSSILIVQYQFWVPMRPLPHMTSILNALMAAAARGVLVTILLNRPDRPRRPGPGHGAIAKFLSHPNISILHHGPRETLHIKACLVDQHLLLLGSHNMSHASFTSSRNVSALIEDASVARQFIDIAHHLLETSTNG